MTKNSENTNGTKFVTIFFGKHRRKASVSRAINLINKYNHKTLTSFVKNQKRYNRSNTAKWISIPTTLLSGDWAKYGREITWEGKNICQQSCRTLFKLNIPERAVA